jgi:hypothetical protein
MSEAAASSIAKAALAAVVYSMLIQPKQGCIRVDAAPLSQVGCRLVITSVHTQALMVYRCSEQFKRVIASLLQELSF